MMQGILMSKPVDLAKNLFTLYFAQNAFFNCDTAIK